MTRRFVLAAVLGVALATPVAAQNLTTAQLQTLKTSVAAASDVVTTASGSVCANYVGQAVNALANSADQNACIAAVYNLDASPTFTVWKTNVSLVQIGDAIDAAELEGMASLPLTRFQVFNQLSPNGVNPSLTDRRRFFSVNGNTAEGIFSGAGGTLTRPRLLVLFKRLATRFERLYATGTGSDPTPGFLVIEGAVSGQAINAARNLP